MQVRPTCLLVLLQARSVIPDMPHIKVDNVRALRGLNLVGALFDGVLIDIIARQKIAQVSAALQLHGAVYGNMVCRRLQRCCCRWLAGSSFMTRTGYASD